MKCTLTALQKLNHRHLVSWERLGGGMATLFERLRGWFLLVAHPNYRAKDRIPLWLGGRQNSGEFHYVPACIDKAEPFIIDVLQEVYISAYALL